MRDVMESLGRENEVLRIMQVLSKSGIEFVVVGGYAVSSLARHRFSVDCDVVVKSRDLGKLDRILSRERFSEKEKQIGFDNVYGGKFVRYAKRICELPVSVDLLVDALVCRQTGASWSFDYVFSNSFQTNIYGVELSVSGKVPKRDLLIAFKSHSARKADVRDIVAMSDAADWSQVINHLDRGDRGKLFESITRVLEDLDDDKLIDSLKGVFSIKEDVRETVERAKKQVAKIHVKLAKSSKTQKKAVRQTSGDDLPERRGFT